jgi:hypothetical protein
MTTEFKKANLFELSGGGIQVTYSASGLEGVPLFSYRDGSMNLQFSGTQIKNEQTEMGEVLTVILKETSDLSITIFALILPLVNLWPGSVGTHIQVPGITVTTHTSFIGAVLGQAKTYSAVTLEGYAQVVAA